eukprot:5332310-Pleurochrysis_carterae.AAC.2
MAVEHEPQCHRSDKHALGMDGVVIDLSSEHSRHITKFCLAHTGSRVVFNLHIRKNAKCRRLCKSSLILFCWSL